MNNTTQRKVAPVGKGASTIGTGIIYNLPTTAVGAVSIGAGYMNQKASKVPSYSKNSRKNIESAVYAHIQAIRALGRTKTDTSEIARALGLTQSTVEETISSLTKKGVKVISG
jgi:hypothetical protein